MSMGRELGGRSVILPYDVSESGILNAGKFVFPLMKLEELFPEWENILQQKPEGFEFQYLLVIYRYQKGAAFLRLNSC